MRRCVSLFHIWRAAKEIVTCDVCNHNMLRWPSYRVAFSLLAGIVFNHTAKVRQWEEVFYTIGKPGKP